MIMRKVCFWAGVLGICGLAAWLKGAPLVNTVVDGSLEYQVETNKAVYLLGEDVEMSFRVTNLSPEEQQFVYMGPLLDLVAGAEEQHGSRNLWFWSWDYYWPDGPRVSTLAGYASLQLTAVWPQIDFNDLDDPTDSTMAIPGVYTVGGYFTPTDILVGVDIEILPEPGPLMILSGGTILGLRRRTANNH